MMPMLPRAWQNRIDPATEVLFDGVIYDPSDNVFEGPSLTMTWEATEDGGETTVGGRYVMVSMTPLQAAMVRDELDQRLTQHFRMQARNEIEAEPVAQIEGEEATVTHRAAANAAEVQAPPLRIQSDPELERLLQEEEAIERSIRNYEDTRPACRHTVDRVPVRSEVAMVTHLLCGNCGMVMETITDQEAHIAQQPSEMAGPEARPVNPSEAELREALMSLHDPMMRSTRQRPQRESYRSIEPRVRPLP